jgi:hypothetical protein
VQQLRLSPTPAAKELDPNGVKKTSEARLFGFRKFGSHCSSVLSFNPLLDDVPRPRLSSAEG